MSAQPFYYQIEIPPVHQDPALPVEKWFVYGIMSSGIWAGNNRSCKISEKISSVLHMEYPHNPKGLFNEQFFINF